MIKGRQILFRILKTIGKTPIIFTSGRQCSTLSGVQLVICPRQIMFMRSFIFEMARAIRILFYIAPLIYRPLAYAPRTHKNV